MILSQVRVMLSLVISTLQKRRVPHDTVLNIRLLSDHARIHYWSNTQSVERAAGSFYRRLAPRLTARLTRVVNRVVDYLIDHSIDHFITSNHLVDHTG